MELLVDEVVMYESKALNKNLICQMSPPVIFLPSAGAWCRCSLSVCHSRAQYTWAATPVLWGRPRFLLVPTCGQWGGDLGHAGSLLPAKLAPKYSQSSERFSVGIL